MLRDDIIVLDPTFRAQSPLHFMPFLHQTKHGGQNTTLRSLSSCTTRFLSIHQCLHMVLAHTTTCPVPRSTAHRCRTQAGIFPTSTSCIIHEARKFLKWGSTPSNRQQIYLSLKPARFSATSTLQHPRGYRQFHAAGVLDKKTALDFAPESI